MGEIVGEMTQKEGAITNREFVGEDGERDDTEGVGDNKQGICGGRW